MGFFNKKIWYVKCLVQSNCINIFLINDSHSSAGRPTNGRTHVCIHMCVYNFDASRTLLFAQPKAVHDMKKPSWNTDEHRVISLMHFFYPPPPRLLSLTPRAARYKMMYSCAMYTLSKLIVPQDQSVKFKM